jgi:hypothetical protein
MGQEVLSTMLYVCALYKQKKSTRTRKAKKVHHRLALQSARAAPCLVYPFPGLSFQGYERESGTRHRRFMLPVAAASALKGLRGGAPGGGWPGRSSAGTPGRAAPDRPGAAPYAGVAWPVGALVRVGGRHCAGRGQVPARAWRELEVGAWCALSECAPPLRPPLALALRAANGVRPSALLPSPPGEARAAHRSALLVKKCFLHNVLRPIRAASSNRHRDIIAWEFDR